MTIGKGLLLIVLLSAISTRELSAQGKPAGSVGKDTVVVDWKPSAGQVVLAPVHVSATSQLPADARQTVPAFPAGCWQLTLVPSH